MVLTEQDIKNAVQEALKNFAHDDTLELMDDPNINGADGQPKRGNFPLRRHSASNPEDYEDYWVSRSNIISLLVYCRDAKGRWCALANQRGSGSWNYVHGYLDYGETLEDAAVRECYEECGVKIKKEWLRFNGTDSSQLYGNVSSRFSVVLQGTTNQYPVNMSNAEPGEVLDVKWIPLNEIKQYKWSGIQGKTIIDVFKRLYHNNGRYSKLIEVLSDMTISRDISQQQFKAIRKILGI